MIRTLTDDDLPALAALNDAAVPAVNALGPDGLAAHVRRCDLAIVIDDADDADGVVRADGTYPADRTHPAGSADGPGPAAFLLALGPGASYPSENYRWFSTHRPGSLYVDRIVVAPRAHGRGLGRALYEAVARHARAAGLAEVTCEVNLRPPNPGSLAFHHRLGFRQVGEQTTSGGAVRVALLAAPTDALGT